MRRRAFYILAACCSAAALLLPIPASAQEADMLAGERSWAEIALRDINTAHDLIRDQTPIPFDNENPAYGAWLEAGLARAHANAARAVDQTSAFYAVARYVNGFQDPHIKVTPLKPLPSPMWPGFIVSRSGPFARVVFRDASDPIAPPVGAEVVSCDGANLDDAARQHVFPYVLNPRLALDYRRAIPRLFTHRVSEPEPALRACDVVFEGTRHTVMLKWRPLPSDRTAWSGAYQNAAMGDAAVWEVTEPAPNVTWIGVPTFSSQSAPKLDELVETLERNAANYRRGRAVVIDLRGNAGGDSQWARRIADAIFGRGLIHRAEHLEPERAVADWRASRENIDYWRRWTRDIAARQFGAFSQSAIYGRWATTGMSRAMERGDALWREFPRRSATGAGGRTLRRPAGPSPFPAVVYLLSNGSCGSSCLSFADWVLFVPGVQLFGSATAADGPYAEVRSVTLPSGLIELTFPQKVIRGASRAPFEAYTPDCAYNGEWSDAKVRAWALATVQSGRCTSDSAS